MGKKNKRVEAEAEAEDGIILTTELKQDKNYDGTAVDTDLKKQKKKQKKDITGVEDEDDTFLNTDLKKQKKDTTEAEDEDDTALNTEPKKREKKQKKDEVEADDENDKALNTKLKQKKYEAEGEDENDTIRNTELKKRKKKPKKKKEQDSENPSNGDGNESEQVVVLKASNGDGKKKKKKQQKNEEKQADENASNENGNVKDQVVDHLSNWNGNEVKDGFEVATDMNTIVVRGIPSQIKEKKVFNLFRGCGLITQVDMSTFPEDGKISEFAFVQFEKEDAAKSALALDGTKIGNRSLKIELSRIRPKKKGSPAKVNGCKSAYIGNLPRVVEEDDLRRFFKDSKIESVELALFRTGKHRCCGYGHLFFADDESLENAMKKNNMKFFDKPIKVSYPYPKYMVPSKEKKVV